MDIVHLPPEPVTEINGDTPTMRLFSLLEVMASRDQLYSLQGLVDATGMPKPTLHRMLQQLEAAGLLQRESDGRHYSTGVRLRRLAENLLLNNSVHGARHAVLRRLVEEIGESCNLTALSGNEVIYLDRVETPAPLRFYLHPGSRVPAHCSASGKLFLAQMSPAQRRRLMAHAPLEAFTPRTLTDFDALEHGDPARRQGRLRARQRGIPARPVVHRGAGAEPERPLEPRHRGAGADHAGGHRQGARSAAAAAQAPPTRWRPSMPTCGKTTACAPNGAKA